MKPTLLALLALATLSLRTALADLPNYTFTTIDFSTSGLVHQPFSRPRTFLTGISGNTVIGYFSDFYGSGSAQGFSCTNGVFSSIDVPGATATYPFGISGNTIVGEYNIGSDDYAFTETNGIITTLSTPNVNAPIDLVGIYGDTVFLQYADGTHAFTETAGIYTPISPPSAIPGTTWVSCISDRGILGSYTDTSNIGHYFLLKDNAYTLTNELDSDLSWGPTAMSGNAIVGESNPFPQRYVTDTAGTITPFDPPYPGILTSAALGIDNGTIVGTYQSYAGFFGYIATPTPEPATFILLAITSPYLVMRRRCR